MKKALCVLTLALALVLLALPVQVMAATALSNPATNLSASISGTTHSLGNAYSGKASTGSVWLKVGALRSAMNGTLTLKNEGSETAQLSFSYSLSGTYSSCTIAGKAVTGSNVYSIELDPTESIAIYLAVAGWKEATITLSNVKLEVISAANATISHNAGGSVSVGGTTVASGTTVEVSAAGTTIKATPASGASFVGWVKTADNSVYSTDATLNYVPTGDISLKAIFAGPSVAAFWCANKTYLFDDLNAAITFASNASNKVVTLAANGTLPKGDYTIPSGVTLLAPFDSNGTLYTTSPGYVEDSYTKPSAYSTLTLANGANITVDNGGAISVSAKVSAKMGYAGAPTSKYGHIAMNAGSSITVLSGGNLYAWGYITGSGNVTVKSGATVYESFQVVDWRGGTASSGMLGNDNKVFPMTQYYVQNVEAPMKLESGSSLQASMIADIISVRVVTVPFLGTSGCMFTLTSGSVTKRYDGSADRLVLDLDGSMSISQTEIELVQYLYSIDLSDYVLPINNNVTLNVNSGTLTLNQDTSLLAGTQLNIAKGSTVKLSSGKRLYVYDETEWKAGKYVYSEAYFRPVNYAHSKAYDRSNTDIIDAKILVNGTLDASAGYLYTTNGGANICSTGKGVVKLQASEDSPTLYAATQSGTSISYSSISLGPTPAQLKQGDGTYLTTAAGTYVYNADHGKWALDAHKVTDEVTNPTCTEAGYTTHTCSCGYSYKDSDTEALGHTAVSDANPNGDPIASATPATCTDAGVEFDYWKCTREGCGVYYKVENDTQIAVEENTWVIPALGHEYTVSENGYTWADDYSKVTASGVCSRDENHVGEIDSINVTSATTNATCSAPGETVYTATFAENTEWKNLESQTAKVELRINENAHAWENACDTTCNNGCGTTREIEHSYNSVVTAPTCTVDGYTTHTCSVCGDSYTDSENPALGCSYSDEWKTDSDNHWHECSVCGEKSEKAAHADTDSDHKCDECAETTSTCVDSDKNHECDCSGCKATVGTHTNGTNTHICDYCGKTASTCSDVIGDGNHNCDVCGEAYGSCDANTEIPAVAATCTTTGLTVGTKCSECGTVQTAQTETPALGHSYGDVTYTWSDDGKSCTATHVCGNDASHNVTINAEIASEQTKAPTCEGKGETTYTATFTENWAETQRKTVADINALNHAWTVTYDFAEDGKTCTATHVCGNDASHNVTINAEIASKRTKAPSCEDKGETTYTATFAESWAETQSKIVADIDALNHAWTVSYNWTQEEGEWYCTATRACGNDAEHNLTEKVESTGSEKTAATCEEAGWTIYTAEFAADWAESQTQEKQDVPVLDHDYAEAWLFNAIGHWHKCNDCDATTELVEHTEETVPGYAATHISAGLTDGIKCSVCDYVIKAQEEIPQASHSYGDQWKHDDSNHWHECVCGDKADLAEHGWDAGVVTTQPTISAAGEKTYTCGTCGTTRTETIDKLTGTTVSLDVLTNNLETGPRIALLTGTTAGEGWDKEGNVIAGSTVDFSVTFDKACVVIVETTDTDGNLVYTKVPAVATADNNTYNFSTNVVEGMKIIVAIKGDVNGDGQFNNADQVVIKAVLLNRKTLEPVNEYLADINEDGFFNNPDQVKMKAILLGRSTFSW